MEQSAELPHHFLQHHEEETEEVIEYIAADDGDILCEEVVEYEEWMEADGEVVHEEVVEDSHDHELADQHDGHHHEHHEYSPVPMMSVDGSNVDERDELEEMGDEDDDEGDKSPPPVLTAVHPNENERESRGGEVIVDCDSYIDENGQFYQPHYEETYEEDLDVTDYEMEEPSIHHDGHDVSYVEFHDTSATSNRKLTIIECEVCGAIIKHPSKIQAHMRTHTGEKPFECNICGMRFTQKTPMLNHYRKHVGDLPFSCGFGCGKKFVNNAQKNAHELRHQGVKRQGPPRPHLKPPKRRLGTVDRTQVKPPSARIHDRHGITPDDERCPIIDWQPPFGQIEQPISASSSKRLDEVIEAVAAGISLPVTKQHSSKSAIIAQCHICGLMLKHPSKIQAHLRTHTGEKPNKCDECGVRFANRYALQMHQKRKHAGDDGRKIPCTWECGMQFISIGTRNEHERIVHAGIKRYECTAPGCRRMFTRRRYLMMHRAKEHSLYAPVFDPHEITRSELMLEAEIDGGNSAVYTEDLLLPGGQRVVQTSDGLMMIASDETPFLEGEFVDDGEQLQYDEEYEIAHDDDSNSPALHDDNVAEELLVEAHDGHEEYHEDIKPPATYHLRGPAVATFPAGGNEPMCAAPSSNLKRKSTAVFKDPKLEPPPLEETVKHVWMDSVAFQPRRQISVRILKRNVPLSSSFRSIAPKLAPDEPSAGVDIKQDPSIEEQDR